ncbi:MAG TPA: pyruvate dehydrogenase (acetyl-transferring) E1 component subunit alpha, partial [Gammaproteobacteria bacterium]|nr:pyruvate dehydrogenase (acetyl-transferring) E1 component subunit alpha [Gammaproteobacteria bacterium]
MSTAASFTIPYTQILNEKSELTQALPKFAENDNALIEMYQAMVLTRCFDKKAIALQRTGKMGTYPSSLGQEAISVAVGTVMQTDDVLIPYYREYGAQFIRGVSMKEILLYWGGDERGMDYQGPRKDFPISVPIASQASHAIGIAYAMKHRNEARVAVAFFGDGSTSKGDFYEALNAAGVWNLPVVFVVNNNQWAISIPRENQTACQTIAQKALAGGISGEQVDGNDIIGLQQVMSNAIERARKGNGPSVVEALSYRLCDHTTADDASRYRDEEEVKKAWQKEPVERLRRYLERNNYWSDQAEQTLLENCIAQVEEQVNAYLDTPPQAPESMFDFMFEKLPHD